MRVEKFRIWFAWLTGNFIMAMIVTATKNLDVVNVLVELLAVAVFIALTIALFRMAGALNRKAAAARRQVLGDDYPG
ncbi:hypothetical protein [Streptomyces sp. 1222.5]|uniref:hypothetical protein n=1 Tax=Streptomyces sp. 1222.5 TaxID=1881026 RepID=UPI003D73C0F1